jgi:3-oxoadipate enol-lactonase
MCARKRTLMLCGLIALALLANSVSLRGGVGQAAAQVDWCGTILQDVDAFNRGEIHLGSYADDMVFVNGPLCAPEACAGKDAFRNYLEYLVALDTKYTATNCTVLGNTAAVTYELRGWHERAAGVERAIVSVVYGFEGDALLSVIPVGFDMEDPETVQFVTWYQQGRVAATLAMGPGRDADQSPGSAVVERYPGFSAVAVRIASGPPGVPQPVNIHEGTCAILGPVAFALTDVAGGVSHTVLDGVPASDLQTGNFAVAVQKSRDEPDAFVACGDIPAAAVEAPAEEPEPVATGFADANGARLYYEVYGDGEPLLMITGIGLDHESWADVVPAFAPEFKVIVFDPRGTGQSSFPEGVDPTMAVMADDAAALLDALGVDAAHVFGWSMGGMVAQEAALRHPEKIRSLILGASTPGGPHSIPSEDWALAALTAFLMQGRDVTTPDFLETLFSPAYVADHRSEAIEYVQRINAGPPAPAPVIAAQAQALASHDTYDRLPSITAPTLIINGTDDPIVPVENARILAERIPGAELTLVEGARHLAGTEKPAEVVGAMLDFLRRHAGQAPAPAARAAPAPAPASLPSAGSGGLLDAQGGGVPVWWHALAAGGALLLAGGLVGLGINRYRR